MKSNIWHAHWLGKEYVENLEKYLEEKEAQFKVEILGKPFTEEDRLNQLQHKMHKGSGLRGDEVHEYIALEIRSGIKHFIEKPQTLNFNPNLMDRIENGSKRATTRKGAKTKYRLGPVTMVNNINKEDTLSGYEIYKIEHRAFCEIDDELAHEEGLKDALELQNLLVDIYGPFDEYDDVTVIWWDQ